MMRKFSPLLLAVVFCLLMSGQARAHEGDVHGKVLTTEAKDLLTDPQSPAYLPEYDEIADTVYFNDIKEGSVEEDNLLQIPFFEEVPSLSWMRHYYNPKTKEGLWSWPSTIEYGETIWSEAIWKYRHGDKENAYYKLGRVIHLLEDMSSVPHVFLDVHVEESKGYEAWVSNQHKCL